MRVCIHRGSNQIGGNCVELESKCKRLLLDLGLPLDAQRNSARYLPPIASLDGDVSGLLGILISHPHIDHCGLISHVSPSIPIGMGPAARRIMTAAAPFTSSGLTSVPIGWDLRHANPLTIGPFKVTPLEVDHSAFDSYALLVESADKKILYSGDLRAHGRRSLLFEELIAKPPQDIDVLLLEGTTIGRKEYGPTNLTEQDIEDELVRLFKATNGLALVNASAQNIDRIISVMNASKRTNRRLIVDLYTAVILEATECSLVPQSSWADVALFIPQAQRVQIKNNGWFELLNKHSTNRIFIENIKPIANESTLLFRPIHMQDLEKSSCLEGARFIYSQWKGYWQQSSYDKLREWITRHQIPVHTLHSSGHASTADLVRLVSAIEPRKVVPIHTSSNQYSKYFRNVEMHSDGDWWPV